MNEVNTNNIASIWLSLAAGDLKSSRILYEKRQYRNAYFMFQQASEKANKAMWLITGILQPDDLFKLSHDQFKTYRSQYKKQLESAETYLAIVRQYTEPAGQEMIEPGRLENHATDIRNKIGYLDGAREKDLVNIPLRDLTTTHRILVQLEKQKITIPHIPDEELIAFFGRLVSWIATFKNEESLKAQEQINGYISVPENREQMRQYLVKAVYVIVDWAFIEHVLSVCAALTIQHSSRTRYPHNGIDPSAIYTRKLPLVKKQPFFIDMLEKALKRMKKHLGNP